MKGEEASNQHRASLRTRPSASVPQGLGSHGRSREISPRRVECRELFSEAEYCKEVEPLFRPPSASLSLGLKIRMSRRLVWCCSHQGSLLRPSLPPQKPHTLQRKFHNFVPTCNFDRGQGRSRFCRLHTSYSLLWFLRFFLPHFPVGWSFRVGS